MHATATTQTMHSAGMTAMHAVMTADPAGHEAMLDDPAMQADCPMPGDGSMPSMHRNGGHDPSSHNRFADGDRS